MRALRVWGGQKLNPVFEACEVRMFRMSAGAGSRNILQSREHLGLY